MIKTPKIFVQGLQHALCVSFIVLSTGAAAQSVNRLATTQFELAPKAMAELVLSTSDAYVVATADLERRAKTRSVLPVDKTALLKYMQTTAKDWTDAERAVLERELPTLQTFVSQIIWNKPEKIYFVRASAKLEDDLPHTRGVSVVLPDSAFALPRGEFVSMLAHEVFHVLTRHNRDLQEASYQLIGFERCDSLRWPPSIEQRKITNPDASLSAYTIAVQYRGKPVNALPYIGFENTSVDTTLGLLNNLKVHWLFVDRNNKQCVLENDHLPSNGAAPEQLTGLLEKVGRNTSYLFHAEEILAENFVALYQIQMGLKTVQSYPSQQLLADFQKLLFKL